MRRSIAASRDATLDSYVYGITLQEVNWPYHRGLALVEDEDRMQNGRGNRDS